LRDSRRVGHRIQVAVGTGRFCIQGLMRSFGCQAVDWERNTYFLSYFLAIGNRCFLTREPLDLYAANSIQVNPQPNVCGSFASDVYRLSVKRGIHSIPSSPPAIIYAAPSCCQSLPW